MIAWLKNNWKYLVIGPLALSSLLSLIPLWDIGGARVLLAAVGAGVLVVLALVFEYWRALALVLGSVVVPWLCLIGFNFAWRKTVGSDLDLGLWGGLIFAGLIFAIAAAGYLLLWREKWVGVLVTAVVLSAANVVGIPLLVSAGSDESHVAAAQRAFTQIDVAIVVPDGEPRPLVELGGAQQQTGWDLQWSVGRFGDAGLDWLLLDSIDEQTARSAAGGGGIDVPGSPSWRIGGDHVVVLDVDGTPPVTRNPSALASVKGRGGEITRWLGLAQRIAPKRAQIAVLLQTTDSNRLRDWRSKVKPLGGSVASVQELGTRSLTDAVQLLAVRAPAASEDLSLAVHFRPVLLFDAGEQLDTPLEIDSFLRSGRVELCHDDQFEGPRCSPVSQSGDLVGGSTHLDIRPPGKTDPEIASSIYVHPRHRKVDGREFVYLDYWWYLAGNPAEIASGTSCGIGLAIPGKTCFDHPSDWEGMTVVVDVSDRAAPTPVALQFAEHKHVVRYDYAEVQDYWTRERAKPVTPQTRRLRRNFDRIDDIAQRPLAFVAVGTHATYWTRCLRKKCDQVAASGTPENRHNGEKWWAGNDTAHCLVTNCVRLIPTRHNGRDAALWNAYGGVWGDRSCILRGAYCTSELSPAAPSSQDRYQKPWKISGYADTRDKFNSCGGEQKPCPPLPEPSVQR